MDHHTKTERAAELFKALADPTRLGLIRLLGERRSGKCSPDGCGAQALCVNALVHKLGLTQSAVSQHLKILKQAGLVRGERQGSFVHYSLDPKGIERCSAILQDLLGRSG